VTVDGICECERTAMRLLRDGFPFGALFGAPLTAIFRELVVPFLGGLGAVVLAGFGLGWFRGRRG
jgi:hypothetical protein